MGPTVQFWHINDPNELVDRGTVQWENGATALIGPPWSVAGVGHFQKDNPRNQDIGTTLLQ